MASALWTPSYDGTSTWATSSTTATTAVWYNWSVSSASTASTTWSGWASSSTEPTRYIDYSWVNWQAPQNVYVAPKKPAVDRDKANKRAEELLRENLTDEQRDMYDRLKKFHVISEDGKRFEIDCGGRRYHNIYELDANGEREVEHCIYQQGHNPLGDNYLAQKLILECDAKKFRRIANQTRLLRASG